MAESHQHAWQQQPRETDKAFRAFIAYRRLEAEERSLSRVVSELGKSRALIEGWSSRWSWVERARTWDNHQELRVLEGRIEEKRQMDEAHLKIVWAVRGRATSALADGCRVPRVRHVRALLR